MKSTTTPADTPRLTSSPLGTTVVLTRDIDVLRSFVACTPDADFESVLATLMTLMLIRRIRTVWGAKAPELREISEFWQSVSGTSDQLAKRALELAHGDLKNIEMAAGPGPEAFLRAIFLDGAAADVDGGNDANAKEG